jgi:plastocyanin
MPRSKLIILAAMILAGSACGSSTDYGSGGNPPPPPNADVLIVVGASTKTTTAFNPNPFSVPIGAGSVGVKWGNADATTHHVVADGASPLFDSGLLAGGSTYTFTFTSTGTFTYHCSIHPGMVGTIQVTP